MGLVAALALVGFADEWCAFLPAGSLEPMRAELKLSYAAASAVLVALPAGGLLGNFLIAAADYVSRRVLASLGALAYGLALIVFGCGHSLVTLTLAAFCWGAASDAFIHGCEVALVDLAGDDLGSDSLAGALAKQNAWSAVGDLLGPATLAVLATLGFSWRLAFLSLGAGMLAYAAWIATLPLPRPQRHEQAPSPVRATLSVVADREVLFLALVLGLVSLLDEPLHGFMIAYLERARGLTAALATLPVAGLLVGAMAAYAVYDRLAGQRPPRAVALLALAAMAASLPAAIFAPLPAAVAAAFVFGAALAVAYTTLNALTLQLRPGQAGAVSAVVGFVGLAGIGFPTAVGWVADRAGLGAGLALYAAVPVAILALLGFWRGVTDRKDAAN
jgi:predicted MFS family arabinose efflux permease